MEMVKLGYKYGPSEARRRWIQMYGEEKAPSISCICRNMKKFEKTNGCLHNQVGLHVHIWFLPSIFFYLLHSQNQFAERPKPKSTPELKVKIFDRIMAESALGPRVKRTSLREFARQNDVSKATLVNIVKELRLKSIKLLEVDIQSSSNYTHTHS